jgi:hypothetical protein
MPQVKKSARVLQPDQITMEEFVQHATVTPDDFWTFITKVLPPNKPMVTRDKGTTPDWLVKLVDGNQEHFLCFQLKSGKDKYSFEQILDELAKCPQVEITNEVSLHRS